MKFKLLFLVLITLTGCTTTEVAQSGEGFFETHTIAQILGWLFFPRLMFWFFSAITGNFFFWLGVLCIPRIMVAFWATSYYWETNPILCVFVWFYALCGEGTEKTSTVKKG